jgi:hypothetical protein
MDTGGVTPAQNVCVSPASLPFPLLSVHRMQPAGTNMQNARLISIYNNSKVYVTPL